MKPIHFLIILTFFTSSCTTYKANVKKHENLQYEAVRVYPEWKYQDPKGKKVIVPILALGAAAAYGYTNETNYGEETYKGAENAAIWGLGGLFVGGIINGILFPKRHKYRSNQFDLSQSEKWMESYNKTTGNNYLIQKKEMKNSLVIVPGDKVENIRAKCNALVIDLNRDVPNTDFEALQTWKRKLNTEYSILPEAEINAVSSAISQHGQKVANIGLVRKSKMLDGLDNEFSYIETLTSFRDKHSAVYYAADKNHQQKIDNKIVEKLNTVLENVLPEEVEKLTALGNTETDLYRINSLYISFKTKYDKVAGNEKVKEVDRKFKEKKAYLLDLHFDGIVEKINSATTIGRLDEMESQYFSNIDLSDYRVNALKTKLQYRRNEFIEKERQQEIAAKELARKNEERKKEMELMEFEQQMNEATLTGEPTEWQMEFAVKYQLNAKSEQIKEIANMEFDKNNPVTSLTSLFMRPAAETEVSISSFEKLGCVAAGGKPGFVCDYVAKTRISGGSIGKLYGPMVNKLSGAEIKTARFAKVKGYWMLVEYMD